MKLTKEKLKDTLELEPLIDKWHPTGSYYICNPPVENTDIDYVVKLKQDKEIFPKFLKDEEWKLCGNKNEKERIFVDYRKGVTLIVPEGNGYGRFLGRKFYAFRKEQFNLIFVKNDYWFDRWVTATEEAKERNLLEKKDRVALFSDVFTNYEKYQYIRAIEWV